MPAERVSMRRVREILRLKYEVGATDRAIARSVGVARSTARLCLDRAAAAGLTWPLPATVTDGALEALLFAGGGAPAGLRRKVEPDWVAVHRDGRHARLMRTLGAVKVLILDDWGLEPLGPEQRRDLLELTEDRYGRGATLITSQVPVDRVSVRNSVCGRSVERHGQAMARVKRWPKSTANWALAMAHSRGGMVHSFSVLFKTR